MGYRVIATVNGPAGRGPLCDKVFPKAEQAYQAVSLIGAGIAKLHTRTWRDNPPGVEDPEAKLTPRERRNQRKVVTATLRIVDDTDSDDSFPDPSITFEWKPAKGEVGGVALMVALKQVFDEAGLN